MTGVYYRWHSKKKWIESRLVLEILVLARLVSRGGASLDLYLTHHT